MLTSPNLILPNISHGFFTRQGGVSAGLYNSLNCGPGSGDDLSHVAENRARVTRRLGASHLLTCHQVHSANAVILDRPWEQADAPQADAIVTRQPGIAIGALAADCTPVLFADPTAGVIAAAHAGWKGAVGGILESTVETMEKLGARRPDIIAAVGPCIAQMSYEVGPEFRDALLAISTNHVGFFTPSPKRHSHYMFDLPGFVMQKLAKIGLTQLHCLHNDTCADETRFFSFRRATLREEPVYGRQVSAIMLRE